MPKTPRIFGSDRQNDEFFDFGVSRCPRCDVQSKMPLHLSAASSTSLHRTLARVVLFTACLRREALALRLEEIQGDPTLRKPMDGRQKPFCGENRVE